MISALAGQEITDSGAKGCWRLIACRILLSDVHQRFSLQPVEANHEHAASLPRQLPTGGPGQGIERIGQQRVVLRALKHQDDSSPALSTDDQRLSTCAATATMPDRKSRRDGRPLDRLAPEAGAA